MKRATLRADAILLLAAAIWGGAFVAQRVAMQHMGPFTFNGLRFALGALVVLPVIAWRGRRVAYRDPVDALQHSGATRLHIASGLVAGLVLFVGASLQQAGLVYTTASKAGFITGLYVPLVPIFGLLVGQRTRATTWAGAGLAVVGLYYLSVTEALRVNAGDALVLACAAVWAVHVLLIDRFARWADPLRLAFVQFVLVAVASLLVAAFTERNSTGAVWATLVALLYGGLFSVGIAYTLQVVGQRETPPGHAALVFSLEAVFAAVAGYMLLGERLGAREICGAALMLAGTLLSQLRR